MRIEWLNKRGSGRVILFFNGWGMDASVVRHLPADCDVVMFYDYRTLESEQIPVFLEYKEVYIVAWSMGVWAAAYLFPFLKVNPVVSVALNGTERPVDDKYGIPLNVYLLTEKGMNERGKEKFFSRMFVDRSDFTRFSESKPKRDIDELCDELKAIRESSADAPVSIKWDRVYIGEKDIIFPASNQQNWWQGRSSIEIINTGHYPFYSFENWNEITGCVK